MASYGYLGTPAVKKPQMQQQAESDREFASGSTQSGGGNWGQMGGVQGQNQQASPSTPSNSMTQLSRKFSPPDWQSRQQQSQSGQQMGDNRDFSSFRGQAGGNWGQVGGVQGQNQAAQQGSPQTMPTSPYPIPGASWSGNGNYPVPGASWPGSGNNSNGNYPVPGASFSGGNYGGQSASNYGMPQQQNSRGSGSGGNMGQSYGVQGQGTFPQGSPMTMDNYGTMGMPSYGNTASGSLTEINKDGSRGRTTVNGQEWKPTSITDMGGSTNSQWTPIDPGGPNNPFPGGNTNSGGGIGWGLPTWNPAITSATPPPNGKLTNGVGGSNQGIQAGKGGVETGFFDAYGNFDPEKAKALNPMDVAQYGQNNFQYRTDFNEAQRRWNAEFGETGTNNQFQRDLSTREQMSAEEQARITAEQWNRQFGHTQNMDIQGLDLSRTQIGNEFTRGMDQNQATRDVANTYAGSNMYQADRQMQGDMYGSDSMLKGNMYGADQQLRGNMYGSDSMLRGNMYQADRGVDVASVYGGAQRYGSDQQLAGQLGSANIYGGAQRYGADRGVDEAGLYSGAQRYGSDQQLAGTRYGYDAQERMNQLQMANNLQVANTQAYGRSEAPRMNWARSWS